MTSASARVLSSTDWSLRVLLPRPSVRRAAASAAGALVASLAPVLLPVALPAAEAAVPASCATSAAVYGVAADGSLREWLDSGPATAGNMTAAAAPVGVGWGGFTRLLPAGSGVLYAVDASGRLRWYRHTGYQTGAATWATGSGAVVGTGWGGFTQLVSASDGVLYGVTADGRLRWYRHTGGTTGAATWATGSGAVIGNGWGMFSTLVGGPFGTLYGVTADGRLRWYAHDGWLTGRVAWAPASGAVVGTGWGIFARLLSGGGGLLYGVKADGSARWYDHTGAATGAVTWATGSGSVLAGVDLTAISMLAADPSVCSGFDPNDVVAVRRVASGVLAGSGWTAAEFSCLSSIAGNESSWRWNAGTPAGSYGIPQAMPGSRMATAGADWQVNPITQVRWMLAYVVGKYATPCAAWAFWQLHHSY